METDEKEAKLFRWTRFGALTFLGLGVIGSILFLAMGSFYYLHDYPVNLFYYVVTGVLLCLVSVFCLVVDIPQKRKMYFLSFFLTSLFGMALVIMVWNYLRHNPQTNFLSEFFLPIFLFANLLPLLVSVSFPLARLFKKEPPLWAILLTYVFEGLLWSFAFYFSFDSTSKILCFALFSMIFLRSSQYLFQLLETPLREE